jgi:lysine/ornithine N-monooxygenase
MGRVPFNLLNSLEGPLSASSLASSFGSSPLLPQIQQSKSINKNDVTNMVKKVKNMSEVENRKNGTVSGGYQDDNDIQSIIAKETEELQKNVSMIMELQEEMQEVVDDLKQYNEHDISKRIDNCNKDYVRN